MRQSNDWSRVALFGWRILRNTGRQSRAHDSNRNYCRQRAAPLGFHRARAQITLSCIGAERVAPTLGPAQLGHGRAAERGGRVGGGRSVGRSGKNPSGGVDRSAAIELLLARAPDLMEPVAAATAPEAAHRCARARRFCGAQRSKTRPRNKSSLRRLTTLRESRTTITGNLRAPARLGSARLDWAQQRARNAARLGRR